MGSRLLGRFFEPSEDSVIRAVLERREENQSNRSKRMGVLSYGGPRGWPAESEGQGGGEADVPLPRRRGLLEALRSGGETGGHPTSNHTRRW